MVGVACLVYVIIRSFMPYGSGLPLADVPTLAAVSVAALVVDAYLDGKKRPARCWAVTAALAFLTFWLLPWAAGIAADAAEALRIGVIGALLFTALAVAFSSVRERLLSGKAGPLAPLCVGFVMYLACQCFAGMLL